MEIYGFGKKWKIYQVSVEVVLVLANSNTTLPHNNINYKIDQVILLFASMNMTVTFDL
jgi:hypothetical protein